MAERLTWEQIQQAYPNQWVGLVLQGKIISRHTNPDGCLQLGMAEVL